MNEITKGGSNFIGYEYKEASAPGDMISMYLDGYKNFGWLPDENIAPLKKGDQMTVKLKRNRKILGRTELTRLQQHFEACMEEIRVLEKSKTSLATMIAISVGILGTVFMALSTFAVTHEPPLIIPCVLFAIPGFILWASPYFVYKTVRRRREERVASLIEAKYDEIDIICEKGSKLL